MTSQPLTLLFFQKPTIRRPCQVAAPYLQTPGRPVPAPVLRVRSQLCRLAVCAVRAVRGVRPLAGARRTAPSGYATSQGNPRSARAEVSADVSLHSYLDLMA